MFAGNSCFPLSPREGISSKKSTSIDDEDQLQCIINVLGKLTKNDKSFITEEEAHQYVDMLQEKQTSRTKGIDQIFPNANPQLLELLKGLLEFNPHFRLSAKQALKSPIFDSIRVPYFEQASPYKIAQKINAQNCFAYTEDQKASKYVIADYKNMLQKEIKII